MAFLRLTGLSLLVLLLAACASAPAPQPAPWTARTTAPVFDTGEIAGATYRIDVPAEWKGDLVVYLHGYEPAGMPREGQNDQNDYDRWLLGQGFAVARSDYSAQGWAVAEALVDTEALRQHFVAQHGPPRRSFLLGHSLGGHLVLATLERHPEHYDGALALCGANAPAAEMFGDAVLSPLVVFDHYFPGALGLAPGGLADPASPPWPDPEAIEKALQGDEGKAQRIADHFDIPRAGLAGGLMIRYAALYEMMQRAGGFPADNRKMRYTGLGDDEALNAGVRRYTGDPAAMAYAASHAALTGDARKPVVLMANHGDPTIPMRISGRYAELAAAAGRSDQVLALPPQGEGHCGFSLEAQAQALDTLVQWVTSGERPAPD